MTKTLLCSLEVQGGQHIDCDLYVPVCMYVMCMYVCMLGYMPENTRFAHMWWCSTFIRHT